MQTTQTALITNLNLIAKDSENSLFRAVAIEVLNQATSDKEVADFFINLQEHGCISGMVGSLIYYKDTHSFFDEHYEEIENLRQSFEEENGSSLSIHGDLKNTLAWFAFESTAYQLSLWLGIPS